MAQARLTILRTNRNSQDRLYYANEQSRLDDFLSVGGITAEASNFERIDDLTINLDIYRPYAEVKDFNYVLYEGYYCFVESLTEKTTNSCKMTLKIDTIATYMTGNNIDPNKEVFVRRTHLDRFVSVGQDNYKYNWADDNLLIKEDFNIEPTVIDQAYTIYQENGKDLPRRLSWIAITKKEESDKLKIAMNNTLDLFFRLPNKTYYFPLVDDPIQFRNVSGADLGIGSLQTIFSNIDTNEIIDVKIIPYLGIEEAWRVYEGNNETVLEVPDLNAGMVQEFVVGNSLSHMLSFATHGNLEPLQASDPTYVNEHRPLISLVDIQSQNFEPKLFQFQKYIASFFQNKVDLFFDALKDDPIDVFNLQRAVNYALEKNDFYLPAGLYDNHKNTGAILSTVTDNTIASNINQFDEYVTQKKASSSASYAYGSQIASGAIQAGIAGITTGGLGAGVSIASSLSGIIGTYKQRQDLKQAPDNTRDRGSNVLNDLAMLDTWGLTVTKARPLQSELDFIEKYLYYNGYKFEQYENINNIINTRVNFNYIQLLNSDNILIQGVSNNVLQDILEQLNNGVRFYKSINILNTQPKVNNERSL